MRCSTLFTGSLLVACLCGLPANGARADDAGPKVRFEGKAERRTRLDAMQGKPFDVSLLQNLTGWSGPALSADAMKGKVVVFVTWSSWYRTSHSALKDAQALFEKNADKGLVVIGVHDQQGFDRAPEVLKNQGIKFPVAMDKGNAFRKAVEVDVDPDIYIVDRAGNMRYADITTNSLGAAVDRLLSETVEQAQSAKPEMGAEQGAGGDESGGEPASAGAGGDGSGIKIGGTTTASGVSFTLPEASAYAGARWPAANKTNLSAGDFQGKKLPAELGSETFITPKPDVAGKVVVIDFWATWCPPCRAAMPGLDKLSKQFADDVVVIGISDEKRSVVEGFLAKNKHSYPQAIDPKGTVNNALQIRGIPHAIVLSTDGVVRWQGHPGEIGKLSAAVGAVVRADPGVAARKAAEAEAKK